MNDINELREIIRRLHGVESEHVESVAVKEIFQGRTVWDGFVEVFDLKEHPTAARAYAWSHNTDDPDRPRRHVAVLHSHPIKSARDAVKAAIVQEFRDLGTAEES
jgi:hypothetical protein